MSTFTIAICGNPNSCLIKIGNISFRSLVDTGAEVSLISRKALRLLQNKPKLSNKRAHLQSVNGNSLQVDGSVQLKFKIGRVHKVHEFYVVPNINRNIILGRDFLSKNGVRLYFD